MKLPFNDKKFLFLLLCVATVVALEILSLSGIQIPKPYAPILFGIFILTVGNQVLLNGIKALFKFNFSSISLLMLIAVCGAFYLKEYPEAAVVIVLYVLGERLEDIGIETSKSALDHLVAKSPKSATLKESGKIVPIEKISIGTFIEIKPGDYIPLDGIIVSGNSTIDEAAITGEPIAKDKHLGDLVFAGTQNKNGYLVVNTTKLAQDTTFSKIIKLTYEAQVNKSETHKFIQKFSKIYTPCIIIIALIIFIFPVCFLGLDVNTWLLQAITLLVIACPCALVISTPVAIYAAIGNASEKGALIKGGKYLELLSQIKAIGLDKTRTITYGKPIVSDIVAFNDISREELLACSSGAEIFSEHPLAEAIVEATHREGWKPHKAKNFESIAGKGTKAQCLICKDEEILVGKLSFIGEHQPITPEAENLVEQFSKEGKTSVVISFGKGVAGIIALTDEIKPDSKQAIEELKKLNIEPIMLTGDIQNAALNVAKQMNIDRIYGGLLPEDKAEKIKEFLLQYKYVAMVGDGINDAPAIAQSTIGIAMGAAGSDTAIETANIALMNDKLSLIPFLVRLSRKTMARIKTNTIGAILIKFIFIILACLGYSNLVLAIAADVGVTIIVILMSLNLMRYGDKE